MSGRDEVGIVLGGASLSPAQRVALLRAASAAATLRPARVAIAHPVAGEAGADVFAIAVAIARGQLDAALAIAESEHAEWKLARGETPIPGIAGRLRRLYQRLRAILMVSSPTTLGIERAFVEQRALNVLGRLGIVAPLVGSFVVLVERWGADLPWPLLVAHGVLVAVYALHRRPGAHPGWPSLGIALVATGVLPFFGLGTAWLVGLEVAALASVAYLAVYLAGRTVDRRVDVRTAARLSDWGLMNAADLAPPIVQLDRARHAKTPSLGGAKALSGAVARTLSVVRFAAAADVAESALPARWLFLDATIGSFGTQPEAGPFHTVGAAVATAHGDQLDARMTKIEADTEQAVRALR